MNNDDETDFCFAWAFLCVPCVFRRAHRAVSRRDCGERVGQDYGRVGGNSECEFVTRRGVDGDRKRRDFCF